MLKCLNGRGFTLIEVVVAVSVLTIGILAAFMAVQSVTGYYRVASSRLAATYLAQEGVELVRNQRDSNWLSSAVSWDNNMVPSGPPGCTDVIGKFTRECMVTSTASEMDISVTVEWQERGTTHTVTDATKLYNWLSP